MTDDILTQRRLDKAAAAIREYAGSATSLLTIDLLNELEASYVHELRACKPEQLAGLQASLKQVCALRDLFRGQTSNGLI